MRPDPDLLRPRRRRSRPTPTGFTLVELTVVVLILAILAAVVLSKVAEGREKAEITQVAANFRLFGDAIQRYHAENGSYPSDTTPGVYPPELDGYLGPCDMSTTPISGRWDFDNWSNRTDGPFLIGMSIQGGKTARYQAIDELLDDGDLATGGVQQIDLLGPRLQFGVVRR